MADKYYIDPDYIDDYFQEVALLSEYNTIVIESNNTSKVNQYIMQSDIHVNNLLTQHITVNQ